MRRAQKYCQYQLYFIWVFTYVFGTGRLECTFSPNERCSFFCVIDDNQLKESPSIVLALREKRTNGPLLSSETRRPVSWHGIPICVQFVCTTYKNMYKIYFGTILVFVKPF